MFFFVKKGENSSPKEQFEAEKQRKLDEAIKTLNELEFTYVVHIYSTLKETKFKIFFYNKDGVCIDIKEGNGENYQFLLNKRAEQLQKRKRFKKVKDNTLTDELILYTKQIVF